MANDVPLAQLQTDILLAALAGRPLPGVEHATLLADLPLVVQGDGTVLVLDDGLAPDAVARAEAELRERAAVTNVRYLRALGLDEAREDAARGGTFLVRFRPVEAGDEGVTLVLETCGIPDPAAPLTTLGALIVSYVRDETGWHPAGPPSQLAT